MPTLWNIGPGAKGSLYTPTIKRAENGKLKEFVKIPPMYTGGIERLEEHKEGNVYVSLGDFGFHVVKKGEKFEVPHGVDVEKVKALCPHLVDEGEKLALDEGKPMSEIRPDMDDIKREAPVSEPAQPIKPKKEKV